MAVLAVAIVSTVAVLITFVFATLVDEPSTAVTLVVISVGCIVADAVWKSRAPASGASVPGAGAPRGRRQSG